MQRWFLMAVARRRGWAAPRLRGDDGLALVMVLGVLLFFSIVAVTAVTMATSAQGTAATSSGQQSAYAVAESGINEVEAMLNYQNVNGGKPNAANLLGCAGANGVTDTTGPSNCSSPTPIVFCVSAASGCAIGSAGSASVYGYFSGASASSYLGRSVPASTWLVFSTGYVKNPTVAGVLARRLTATITITPITPGEAGALWNYVFITAPLAANTCPLDFTGVNNANLNVPFYVIGNACLGTNSITETTQAIDLMVGGKLYMTTGSVGSSAAAPITRGVVVGGCTTVSVTATTSPCDNGAYRYWVKTKDTFIPQDAPSLTATQMTASYGSFDPGPNHPCLAGTNPAPLSASTFDSSTGGANEPDDSGSVTNGSAFELVPNSSYACISQNGTSTGYLIWNNNSVGSITVSGITVPAKTLAINGSIFFDSNVTMSQAFTYTGVGVIDASGTFTFIGNSTTACPVACSTHSCPTNWQGLSGNASMLTIVSLASNTTAISFGNSTFANNQVFAGSLWTQPSSKVSFVKNNDLVAGPMTIGNLDSTFNNAVLCPLPSITNMPTTAPLPPGAGATISPPIVSP